MSHNTISDVAKAAGVSVSTVSRILNDKSDVAAATRQRVLQVIEAIGYYPHVQAQRLRADSRRCQTISLLFPVEQSAFDPDENATVMLDFALGISRVVEEKGYQLNLITTPITEHRLCNLYRSSLVEGTILMKVNHDVWRVQRLRETNFPFVMIRRTEDNDDLDFIDFDYESAVIVTIDHLVNRGHKKIGFISYPHPSTEKVWTITLCRKRVSECDQ